MLLSPRLEELSLRWRKDEHHHCPLPWIKCEGGVGALPQPHPLPSILCLLKLLHSAGRGAKAPTLEGSLRLLGGSWQ